MASALRLAFAEARAHVFGRGFDRSFRFVLAGAALVWAILLWRRAGPPGVEGLLAGLAGSVIYLAMPFVAVFIYMFGVSFLDRLIGRGESDDPPMPIVFAAFLVTLAAIAGVVYGVSHLPFVGAQLRSLFV